MDEHLLSTAFGFSKEKMTLRICITKTFFHFPNVFSFKSIPKNRKGKFPKKFWIFYSSGFMPTLLILISHPNIQKMGGNKTLSKHLSYLMFCLLALKVGKQKEVARQKVFFVKNVGHWQAICEGLWSFGQQTPRKPLSMRRILAWVFQAALLCWQMIRNDASSSQNRDLLCTVKLQSVHFWMALKEPQVAH